MQGHDPTCTYSYFIEDSFNSSYDNMETFCICKNLKTYKNCIYVYIHINEYHFYLYLKLKYLYFY